MFTNKFISLLMSAVISVNTTMPWFGTITVADSISEVKPQIAIEDVAEAPLIEIVEEPIPEAVEDDVTIYEPIIADTSDAITLSESDIDLISLVTMAEAEGECEEGKRLVIDVILNRYESSRFPDTISGVIYAKNAFECMVNGRVNRCYVRDDIRQLVTEELQSRTNSNVHYFRTNHYHGFGIPVVQVGNHYFSTY